ncbi:MAG TPA: hypothetical protein VI520_07040 [Anaerolineales bacterium]|jgi:hypothetical protein|nr:hypothetical protein [Anaerolineales bacterium]
MTLEQVVHRIATDSAFAASVREYPEAALKGEAPELSSSEIRSLMAALTADETQKAPGAALPWFESQLASNPDNRPQTALPWFEAQLGMRPV